MANASTAYVIEIETGIGEPGFIPLTLGQELQPISLGRNGMWRVDAARVLDVHAFVYFDGTALFLQSADESAPVFVDGDRVGRSWTELHAPCQIEIGTATLQYRARTSAEDGPTAQAAGLRRPNTGRPPAPRPAAGAPPPAEAPLTFPKADRVLSSDFTSPPRGSPRVPPLDASRGARPVPQGSSPSSPPGGRGVEDDRAYSAGAPPRAGRRMHRGFDASTEVPTVITVPPGATPSPVHAMHTGMMAPPDGSDGFAEPPGPAAFGPRLSPAPIAPPHGYGPSPLDAGRGGPEGTSLAARYARLPALQRALLVVAPLCLLASAYLVLGRRPPTLPGPDAAAPTAPGADTSLATNTGAPLVPSIVAPPQVTPTGAQPACPPGFVPYSMPATSGVVPCVPIGTPMPSATAASQKPTSTASGQRPPPKPAVEAGAPTSASTKTLERQAVDYVAVNDYARAAAVYEQLHARNPSNRVYAEAARILRAKADAGAP